MQRGRSRVARPFAALLVLLSISTATSSGNIPASVCTDYPSVEVVFIGTLTAFTLDPISSPMKFESVEPLVGESGYSITVLREGGSLCHNPDPPVIGQRYLLIATGPWRDGRYSCTDLKHEDDAAADIEYFRLVRSGATPTEVSGEVRVTGEGTPISGAKVHLTGEVGQTQLISNKKGRFHAVLKPGTYTVTAEFPTGYEAENCGGWSVTLAEHRCARLVLCGKPKTSTSPPSSNEWR